MVKDVYIPKEAVSVRRIISDIFGNDAAAIYLYGSATLGGLRPDSDIDVLAVLERSALKKERRMLTKRLSEISGSPKTGKRPLEVTLVNGKALFSSRFPLKCEYMYGEWLRERIDGGYVPGAFFDPDMTVILWQVRQNGVPLMGKAPESVLPPVSEADVRKAIKLSLPMLIEGMRGDERNVLLTLARMWFTSVTGELCPKDVAADWAVPRLPLHSAGALDAARKAYLGEETEPQRADADTDAAGFMQTEILKILK